MESTYKTIGFAPLVFASDSSNGNNNNNNSRRRLVLNIQNVNS